MLRQKRLVISIVAFICVGSLLLFYPNKHVESVHYHAGFVVYIDGVKQDFSNYKYMNFIACSEHDTKKSKAEEQIEKAHLHDGVGDVVHVHRVGAKWGDLFKNIGVTLPEDTNAAFYINGEQVSDIYNQPIKAYETATFVFGNDKESHKDERVSLEHIKEVEAKSELCGKGE